MDVEISGRHLEITPALRDHVNSRASRIEKYVSREFGTRVVLEVDKLRHIAEIVVNVKGSKLAATSEAESMYAAIDGAMDKLEQQLRRYKEKNVHHKGGESLSDEALSEPASAGEG
ncbi:MAG: ribosome hibernation-promoting factor, HPF/YfiA family [Leptospirillia bacterium]